MPLARYLAQLPADLIGSLDSVLPTGCRSQLVSRKSWKAAQDALCAQVTLPAMKFSSALQYNTATEAPAQSPPSEPKVVGTPLPLLSHSTSVRLGTGRQKIVSTIPQPCLLHVTLTARDCVEYASQPFLMHLDLAAQECVEYACQAALQWNILLMGP